MKAWLGNLILVEYGGEPTDYTVRLAGTNIEAVYGTSRLGRGIESLTSDAERRLLLEQYRTVYEGRQPANFEADFESSEGKFVRQSKLLLPLSDDGSRVTMILGAIYFR